MPYIALVCRPANNSLGFFSAFRRRLLLFRYRLARRMLRTALRMVHGEPADVRRDG